MKKVDKQNRLRWLAAVCIIWGVLIELHFTAAGQYGAGIFHYAVHHGLTAYRNNVPVTYFGGMEATVSLIWIPALLMGLIPLGIGLWMKKKAPAQ